MQFHHAVKNDAQFVAGFVAAIDEVEHLLMHTEDPVESLKEWVRKQSEICAGLDADREDKKLGKTGR